MPGNALGTDEDVFDRDLRTSRGKANPLSRFLKKHPIFTAYVVFSILAFLNTGFLELVIDGIQWLWSFV